MLGFWTAQWAGRSVPLKPMLVKGPLYMMSRGSADLLGTRHPFTAP